MCEAVGQARPWSVTLHPGIRSAHIGQNSVLTLYNRHNSIHISIVPNRIAHPLTPARINFMFAASPESYEYEVVVFMNTTGFELCHRGHTHAQECASEDISLAAINQEHKSNSKAGCFRSRHEGQHQRTARIQATRLYWPSEELSGA